MTIPSRVVLASLFCLTLLVGCGGPTRGTNPDPDSGDYAGEPGDQLGNFGSLTGGDSLLSFGTNKKPKDNNGGGTGLGVNAYLWRGALDTLSFMPLASADPFGGVIVTDWYSPPTSNGERFKATAYILGRELRTDAIRVAIYRQVLQNGQWVDAPVSPMTVGEIEDKVLARARELRVQSASNG